MNNRIKFIFDDDDNNEYSNNNDGTEYDNCTQTNSYNLSQPPVKKQAGKQVAKQLAEHECYSCGSIDCFDESDLISCVKCGMVQDRPFDSKVEYRMFSNDDRGGADPTRIGAPQDPTLPQSSLSTVILNGTGHGKRSNKDMFRIRRYHSWNTIPYKERALIQAYDRLSLISSNNGINHAIIDTAKTLYVNVKTVAGRNGVSRDAMLSACVYTALKDSGTPRKPKDIAQMFGITTTVFTKAIKKLQTILMMARQKGKISVSTAKKLEGSTTKASEYMLLPLSRLGIPKQDQELIYQMGLVVSEHIDGMTFCQENMPPSLAGGCLAFVIGKIADDLTTKSSITHEMIADACEISVATLQKCLKRIEENTGEIDGGEPAEE